MGFWELFYSSEVFIPERVLKPVESNFRPFLAALELLRESSSEIDFFDDSGGTEMVGSSSS